MNRLTSYNNIVYEPKIIQTSGDLALEKVVYRAHEDLQESILFLQIQPEQGGDYDYTAQLFVKAPNATETTLQSVDGQALLKEKIKLKISKQLLRLTVDIQQTRHSSTELMRVLKRYKHGQPEDLENQLAEGLKRVFFTGDIGTICRDFIDLLHRKKINELLLIIASTSEKIRNLPWEIVIHQLTKEITGSSRLANDSFGLIRSSEQSFKRFDLRSSLPTTSPLKLLFITALPENLSERNKLLEIEDEQRKLIEAIGGLEAIDQPKIVIEFLDNASLKEIDAALKVRKHDIVHISGHGSFDENIQQGVLYLEDEDGNENQVKGKQLGQLLSHHKCIRLLLLSACETAIAGKEGTCEELAQYSGIPAILGMRFAITDLGAKSFTTVFYERLAKGETLTHAIAEAREVLWQYIQERREKDIQSRNFAEWFTPVLYQNQYVAALVGKSTYEESVRRNFYPKLTFLKGKHTRLVGQGFIGRKSYLIRLRRAFLAGQHVCLYGLGGLGKTTLAEAFADNYRKRFGHHTIFIFRDGSKINEKAILDKLFWAYEDSQPDKMVLREAKTFLESDVPTTEKLQLLLDNFVKGRKIILIFDNFEDVQEKQDPKYHPIENPSLRLFIQYLVLHSSANCHILFTTRYAISGLEKHVLHFQLDKMSYAEQYRYMNYSEVLRAIPMTERQVLHRRLDGHPRSMDYLEALKRKSSVHEWGALSNYIQNVENQIFDNLLLERIYALLPKTEQLLLQQAGVLVGRSPLATLMAISEQPKTNLLSLLRNLQQWSLCFWDEKQQNLEVHALTREWLRQKRLPKNDTYKTWAFKAGMYFGHPENEHVTIDALILAKSYFEIAESWADFTRISFKMQHHYQRTGFYQKVIEINQEILEKTIVERERAYALNEIGYIHKLRADYDQALEYYQQSITFWRIANDRHGEADTLNNMAGVYKVRKEFDRALEMLFEVRQIDDQIGTPKETATTLNNIALIYRAKDDNDRALKYLHQSREIIESIDFPVGLSGLLNNIANIHRTKGDDKTALEYHVRSLQIREDIGYKRGIAESKYNIGELYFTQNNLELAISNIREAHNILEDLDSPYVHKTRELLEQIYKKMDKE